MKKLAILLTLTFILGFGGNIFSAAYVFSTDAFSPLNGGLDHDKAYTWGMETPWGEDDEIYAATLYFNGIYNWRYEENYLFINLRDDAPVGITEYVDPSPDFEDYFAGMDVPIGTWSDPVGKYENRIDLSFDLGDLGLLDDLTTFALDGNFGVSLDPDCHYYVIDKVTLVVQTSAIPEPATMILLGVGLAGLGIYSRKKF